MPPTKEQHDQHVAVKGRPYTDTGMRPSRNIDEYAPDIHGLTVIDVYIAHARKARGDA